LLDIYWNTLILGAQYILHISRIRVKQSQVVSGRVKVQHHTFVTSTPEEGEKSVSRPGCLTPRQSPRYLLNMRLDGPSASLDALEKRSVYFPAGNRNTLFACPVHGLVITPTVIYRLSKLSVNTVIWKDVILEVIVTAVTGQNSKILLVCLFQRHRTEVN
jgi:hypothetical protein